MNIGIIIEIIILISKFIEVDYPCIGFKTIPGGCVIIFLACVYTKITISILFIFSYFSCTLHDLSFLKRYLHQTSLNAFTDNTSDNVKEWLECVVI